MVLAPKAWRWAMDDSFRAVAIAVSPRWRTAFIRASPRPELQPVTSQVSCCLVDMVSWTGAVVLLGLDDVGAFVKELILDECWYCSDWRLNKSSYLEDAHKCCVSVYATDGVLLILKCGFLTDYMYTVHILCIKWSIDMHFGLIECCLAVYFA